MFVDDLLPSTDQNELCIFVSQSAEIHIKIDTSESKTAIVSYSAPTVADRVRRCSPGSFCEFSSRDATFLLLDNLNRARFSIAMNLNENRQRICSKQFLPSLNGSVITKFELNSTKQNSFACLDGKIMGNHHKPQLAIVFIFIAMILFAFVFCARGCSSLRMRLRLLFTGERDVNMVIDPIELLRQDQISQLIPVIADEEEENVMERE
jgi:hypothetical protein